MQKQHGFLLATVGSLVASAGSAQAADMPVKAPRVGPPPLTWSGCYFGVHLGAAFHGVRAAYEDGGGNGFGGSGWGVIGGGQLGCNWQTNNWVWGLEGDISGLGNGARSPGPIGKGNALESDLKWLSTIRARLGYAVAGGMMAYVTGGLAIAKMDTKFSPNGLGATCTQALCSKTYSKTRVGWAGGFGVEHMLTRNWTAGLEALYVNFKFTAANVDRSKTTPFRHGMAIVRGKLNYKF